MDCEQAVTLICARLDGELREQDRAGLEEHLATCPACRATAEAFAIQDGELRRAFGPRRRAATMRSLAVADRIVTRPRRPYSRPDRALIRLAAFVAGLAAAGLVFFFIDFRQPPPSTGPKFQTRASIRYESLPDPTRGGLHPQPFVRGPRPAEVAAGGTVETKAGERRRVAVSKGVIVYLDENTRFQSNGAGQGVLTSGRICIAGPAMTVTTPDRTIILGGGRCEIRSDGKQTGVFAINGSAMALPNPSSGQAPEAVGLVGGTELLPGERQVKVAPRAVARLGWMRDLLAEEETPLVPPSSYGGGTLVAVDANGEETKLSLRKYHIDVYIEDGFARTTIDQTYFNHHPWRLEGTFYFPLPPDASLSRLAMYVGGKLMEGGMAERDHAGRVDQQIVTSQRDPALLEWVDGSTFKMRVFPLEGRQEKRIILSYTQRLPDLYGKTTYRFPSGHGLQVVRDWSFHARVKGGGGLVWGSPTHPSVQGATDGRDLVLTDAAADVKADRDVVVELDSGKLRQTEPEFRFVTAVLDGKRYLMLRYRPALPQPVSLARKPRNWVFLCESSADRDPLLARAQIEIIRQMVANAGSGDTFNVLTAATRTNPFWTEATPASPGSAETVCGFLKMHLVGALDLGRAFDDAAKFSHGDNTWLVHLGSGYTAMGVREDALAGHLPAGVHYVGVGVGKHWNRSFMKQLAERSGGLFTQINPDESLAWRALDLVTSLDAPRLQGVTVESTGEQPAPVFLADSSTLCEGEELCAVARLASEDGRPLAVPREVTVRGVRDGSPVSMKLPVPEALPSAGYVPRTWAKLEVDRLLAAGGTTERGRIVELSKSMYVMSPFTSLLVLENDEMYARFKVDRGRKDHWAMYPCPAEVPVVYEPEPGQPADVRNVPNAIKPQPSEVMQTVLVRGRPSAAKNMDDLATEVRFGSVSDPEWNVRRPAGRRAEPPEYAYGEARAALFRDDSSRGKDYLGHLGGSRPARRARPQLYSGTFVPDGFIDVNDSDDETRVRGSPLARDAGFDPITGRPLTAARRYWNSPPVPIVPRDTTGSDPGLEDLLHPIHARITRSDFDRFAPPQDDLGAINTREGSAIAARRVLNRLRALRDSTDGKPGEDKWGRLWNSSAGVAAWRLSYERPAFTDNPRLFRDLVAYAPGLNTSTADVRAVLEAEAAPEFSSALGHIEPKARQLIEAARSSGWQKVALSTGAGKEDFTLTFDGAGRFVSERLLPIGLRERVVCDGDRLLHLYPELGVGSTRSVSRFHRAELPGIVPWLIPPAEDLARGADVRLVDDHTVAIIPNGANQVRALHLVFAAGRLAERQVVDIGTKRLLGREVYDGAGGVRWLDAEVGEIARRDYSVRPAETPALKPDTSSFVLLPLPFRSRKFVFAKLHLDPALTLLHERNKGFASLDAGQAAELLAAALVSENQYDARALLEGYFGARGDSRHGLFTVAAACGADLGSTASFHRALNANGDDPLLRYLLPPQGSAIGGDGLLHRLAVLHDLTLRWQASPAAGTKETVRRGDMDRTMAFVRENASWPLTLPLLALVQKTLKDEDKQLLGELADARGIVAARSDDYVNRYEQARLLLMAGRKDEAANRFLKLYAKGLETGALPRFDGSIREALGGDGRWGQLMRQTADHLVTADRRTAVITLAWQCRLVEDVPSADSLVALALDHVPDDQRPAVTRAAVDYLWSTAPRRADELLRYLMDKEPSASDAGLWRLRADIAGEMHQDSYAATCLERALDLEYRDLPAVIDLASWRGAYKFVLEDCRKTAAAAKSLGVKPPPELAARIVRTADRWRSHDPEYADACETAAAALADIGEADLAWDYLTTAVASRPHGPQRWRILAAARRSAGDREEAERAYEVACAAEPEDAGLLWDRAQNLLSANRAAAADALLRRLADGQWPAKYAPVRELAREQLRR